MSSWDWISNSFYNGELFFYIVPLLLVAILIALVFLPDEEELQEPEEEKELQDATKVDVEKSEPVSINLDLSADNSAVTFSSLAEDVSTSDEMVDAIPISLSTEDFSKPKTLEDGLQKTKTGFMARLKTLFSASVVDDALIEELEEILYTADIGSTAVQWLLDGVHKERKSFESGDDVKTFMKKEILAVLQSVEKPLLPPDGSPGVLLMVGVNGAGKTTTIGKLASLFRKKYDKKVLLAAGDTFRAAAVEQLEEWGRRAECEVIKEQEGTDPAAVAFNAVSKAKAQNADIVIVDTAGRLQNRVNLMEELKKVRRVIDKAHQGAPHEVLLVVDANNGQNAVRQAVEFHQMIGLTGIIVTKLDGTAKGGVVIGIARELGIPVRLIGIGEKIEDLRPFNAFDFTEALFN